MFSVIATGTIGHRRQIHWSLFASYSVGEAAPTIKVSNHFKPIQSRMNQSEDHKLWICIDL